jgi:hypothetical protein
VAAARCWGTPGAIGQALRTNGLIEGGERGVTLLRDALEHSPAASSTPNTLVDGAPRRAATAPPPTNRCAAGSTSPPPPARDRSPNARARAHRHRRARPPRGPDRPRRAHPERAPHGRTRHRPAPPAPRSPKHSSSPSRPSRCTSATLPQARHHIAPRTRSAPPRCSTRLAPTASAAARGTSACHPRASAAGAKPETPALDELRPPGATRRQLSHSRESGSWRRVDWDDRRSSGAAVIRSRAET